MFVEWRVGCTVSTCSSFDQPINQSQSVWQLSQCYETRTKTLSADTKITHPKQPDGTRCMLRTCVILSATSRQTHQDGHETSNPVRWLSFKKTFLRDAMVFLYGRNLLHTDCCGKTRSENTCAGLREWTKSTCGQDFCLYIT